MVFDSHCHAWRRWPYSPLVPDEDSRGTIEQLVYELDANGVEQALVVCAGIENNPDNIDYAAFARERYPDRLHLVPDLDCWWSTTYHSPGGADRLRALDERYAPVGFTHYLAEDNDGWLRSDEAEALFTLAGERQLLVSLGAGPTWHADLRDVAQRHPEVAVLCNSLGGAHAGDAAGIAEVLASAAVPNIHLKVAGFHYCSAHGWNHPWPDAVALLERLAATYGPARLCWGSDFPASKRYCTYRQSLEVVRSHCPFFGQDDLRLVLGENLRGILAGRLRLVAGRFPA